MSGLSALPSRLRIASRIWRARCTSISSGTFTESPKSGPRLARGRPERIAIGVLLAAAFAIAALIALHRLQLLHHVLGALAQRLKRAALMADSLVAFALAKRLLGIAHGFSGIAKPLIGFKPHAFQALLQLVELALQLALAFLQLLHRIGEFLRRHRLRPGERIAIFAGAGFVVRPWPAWSSPSCWPLPRSIWSMR